MAFLDHTFLRMCFPGMTCTCSASYVKAGQSEQFALCLRHAILKWKIQAISQQPGMLDDGHRPQTYRFTAFNLKLTAFIETTQLCQ